MPLTPAHIAAAWPIHRLERRLPLSALVIGTMSPDFAYLLRLEPGAGWTHAPIAILTFGLPASLVVWGVFLWLVRPAVLDLLPPGLAQAIGRPSRSIVAAGVAAAIGAWTHLAWDACTHTGGWFVVNIPVLETVGFLGRPLYKWLQYGSSGLGLAVVGVWIAWWVAKQPRAARRFEPGQRDRLRRVAVAVGITASIGFVLNALRGTHESLSGRVGLGAVGAMAGIVLALVAFGLADRRRRGNRRAQGLRRSA